MDKYIVTISYEEKGMERGKEKRRKHVSCVYLERKPGEIREERIMFHSIPIHPKLARKDKR